MGDSKVSDNRAQDQGGVEGSWPEQASIGVGFQLGKSTPCRWETPQTGKKLQGLPFEKRDFT